MPYTVGQIVHLAGTFKDLTGTLTDPSLPVVNITTPAGVTTQFAAVKDSTGTYHYDYTPTVAGSYTWWFAGTGVAQLPDIFTVVGALSGALISIADARAQINDAASFSSDELWRYIQAATEIINRKCGYTASTQFVETVAGRADASGRTTIVLSRTPVLSVQSIVPQMQGLPSPDVTAVVDNPESGVIYLSNWWQFYGPMVVTYTAGRGFVPAALQTACVLIVESFVQTQRGGGLGAPGLGGDEMDLGMAGLPYRAVQLMDMSPYDAAPGIA